MIIRYFLACLLFIVSCLTCPLSDVHGQWMSDATQSITEVPAPSREFGGWVASKTPASFTPNIPATSTNSSQVGGHGPQVVYASYFQTQGFAEFPSAFPNAPPPGLTTPPPNKSSNVLPSPPLNVFPSATPNTTPQNGGGAAPSSGLRYREAENFTSSGQPQPHIQTQQFTTGLPFVTPAPGRYPTSPYTGFGSIPIYQNVGYQRMVPATTVAHSMGQGSPMFLPQYQSTPYQAVAYTSTPAPGIYPTGYQQCQVLPPPSLPPDGAAGYTYVPPTLTPNLNPGMYSPNNMGLRPLISLGQENYNVVLGRGIVGQPTAYVPGQYIRNFLRYISP